MSIAVWGILIAVLVLVALLLSARVIKTYVNLLVKKELLSLPQVSAPAAAQPAAETVVPNEALAAISIALHLYNQEQATASSSCRCKGTGHGHRQKSQWNSKVYAMNNVDLGFRKK